MGITPMSIPMSYLGHIQYSTGQGVVGASLYYGMTVNTSGQYNINGTYQDLAMLIGMIIATIGVTWGIAYQIAGAVCAYLALPLSFTAVIFPNHFIQATTTTMDWKIYDASNFNRYNTFSGVKSLITETGYPQKTYIEGEYYTTSDYYNHNILLVQTIFFYLFAGPYSIYSWS